MGFSAEVDDEIEKAERQYFALAELLTRVKEEQGIDVSLPKRLESAVGGYAIGRESSYLSRVQKANRGGAFTEALKACRRELELPEQYRFELEKIVTV